MQKAPFVLDTENLIKAGKVPIIIAAALGLTYFIRIYLGYLRSPAMTFLEAYAGAMYMKSIMDSDKKNHLLNAGLNGAVLGGAVILVYMLVSWVAGSIVAKDWSMDAAQVIFTTVEGAFIGLLGALAWFAYKTQNRYQVVEKDIM